MTILKYIDTFISELNIIKFMTNGLGLGHPCVQRAIAGYLLLGIVC